MSTRRRAHLLGALALVLLAALWGGSAGADDVTGTVQRVSWWTNRIGAQPTVEPARFEVAFGTDKKPTSVAAIDVALPVTPVQALTISLTELAGTANQLGHVQVCLASPGWATANAGALDQAPSMDCSNPADLTRSVDGNWLGDIAGLVPNGGTASLGVVLVNDLDAPVSIGATVQVSDIKITGQSGEAIAPTETTTPPVTSPGGAFDDSFIEPSPGFVPPSGSFDVPPVETPAAVQPAAATTTTAPPPAPLLPASFEDEAAPWWRLAILLPLAIGIGFATVYGRRALEGRGVSFS
ncbi:MAG: hypothetical protein ACJ739_11910 [Acidimicrobiales bacterium]